jgi:hypothetical protein
MTKKPEIATSCFWSSAGAIFAGFLLVIMLSLGTDAVLRAAGLFPRLGQSMSDGLILLATAYRTVYGVIGSYITARLARNRPMWHAITGGIIGLVLSIVGAIATWNKVPPLGPHWYPVALVITALPCAWLGGRLRVQQLRAH